MISWLAQEGPHAKKHHGWAHPIAVLIIHYTLLISFSILVQDLFVPSTPMQHITPRKTTCQSWRQSVGSFLAVYSFWLLLWRLLFCAPTIPRPSIIYEYTWLCNGTLVLGSLACFTDRPVLAMACCVTVGIDQLLWYVDLLGYFISGKFVVGVAKYLTWPQTSWSSRVTCTHHLWTIPLLMTTSGGAVPLSALGLSFLLMTLNVCLSRFMIPFHVIVPSSHCNNDPKRIHTKQQQNTQPIIQQRSKYLNVNLSHELWKDIKIELLQINYDDPPVLLYTFRLLWRWQGFNTLVYGVLMVLGKVFFDGDKHVCYPQYL